LNMSKVVWLDNFNPNSTTTNGYSYASGRIQKTLTDVYKVGIVSKDDLNSTLNYPNIPINIGYFCKFTVEDSDLIINNTLPVMYSVQPSSYKGYSVGFSYWETNLLPEKFVSKMNKMDEVWTTSKWAKEVFEQSGVDVPVKEFNLGFDPDLYTLQETPPDGPFTFLCMGSPSTRKNSQMVVDAFLRLFSGDNRYKLIFKSSGPPDSRIDKGLQTQRSIYGHPQIEVIDYELTEEELSDLYDRCHCLAYPTSGEGWGMIPFNAIGKGIPTICTNATACTEYAELSIPLDFKWSQKNMNGIYKGCGDWAEPDFDDLCDKMLFVANNYDSVKQFTLQNSWFIRNEYSWKEVCLDYYNAIIDVLYVNKYV
jgi:glycosyltransferase involved in cell wall biosynthesis